MFFHVLGIKEIGGKNYNLDFVTDFPSEQDLRNFLSRIGIVVLGIEQYRKDLEEFGLTKLIIKKSDKDEQFFVVIKSTDYRKSYLLITLIGLEVVNIESLDLERPINKEELAVQITEWNTQLSKLKEVDHNNEKIRKEHDFDIQDHKITEMQLLASQVIKRSQVIQKNMIDDMDVQEQRKINELTQELSKIRLGTNIEKMKMHANEIISIINTVEKRQLNKLKDFEQSVFQGSAVTNIDIAKEVQKFAKAEDIKKFGGKKTANDQFYIFLGKIGFTLKFLSKDFLNKASKIDQVARSVFSFFQILFILLLIPMGIYLIYSDKFLGINNVYEGFVLIKIAVFAFLFYTISAFAKKKYLLILIGVILSVPLYFLIIMIIRNTLSL